MATESSENNATSLEAAALKAYESIENNRRIINGCQSAYQAARNGSGEVISGERNDWLMSKYVWRQ
jgi:hypothetical protein